MKIGYVPIVAMFLVACTDDALVVGTSDVGAAPGSVDAKAPGEACAILDEGDVFASSDDVRSKVSGTWRQCGGAKIGISPLDTEGLRLTAQAVHFLRVDAAGDLAGSDDYFANGILEIANIDGGWQVVFDLVVRASAFRVRVSADGSRLFLDDVTRGVQSTFVRAR